MLALQNSLFQQFMGGVPGKYKVYFCKVLEHEVSQGTFKSPTTQAVAEDNTGLRSLCYGILQPDPGTW